MRTDIDFSKHEVTIKQYDGVLIHVFKRPDTIVNSIRFINAEGILAVTGDFGNWIFCREFHPSSTSDGVSEGYWMEKLQISSEQNGYKYNSEKTKAEIQKLLDEEDDLSEEEIEYLNECMDKVEEGEFDYTAYAYRENVGRFEDGEYVPFCKDIKIWLKAIFDGFDALCKLLKTQEEKSAIK